VWNPTELQERKRKRNKGGGKKRQHKETKKFASGLPYYCTPLVWVPGVIGALTVWLQNIFEKKSRQTKNQKQKAVQHP